MNILKLTTDAGVVLLVNPINVGVWSEIPDAAGVEAGCKIEVNGVPYLLKDSFKRVDKEMRAALAPE